MLQFFLKLSNQSIALLVFGAFLQLEDPLFDVVLPARVIMVPAISVRVSPRVEELEQLLPDIVIPFWRDWYSVTEKTTWQFALGAKYSAGANAANDLGAIEGRILPA